MTIEDGGRSGGIGAAVTDVLSPTGVPVTVLALPQQFLEPASRGDLLADLGLTAKDVARGITELIARCTGDPGAGAAANGTSADGATVDRVDRRGAGEG